MFQTSPKWRTQVLRLSCLAARSEEHILWFMYVYVCRRILLCICTLLCMHCQRRYLVSEVLCRLADSREMPLTGLCGWHHPLAPRRCHELKASDYHNHSIVMELHTNLLPHTPSNPHSGLFAAHLGWGAYGRIRLYGIGPTDPKASGPDGSR